MQNFIGNLKIAQLWGLSMQNHENNPDFWELGNEISHKKVFLKLDKCRALLKTWLLVALDLWWDKETRKSIYVNW